MSRNKGSDAVDLFRNIFIFSFLTYPFLFTIDRANIEGWLFLLYVGFLIAYQKKIYNSAAIIIGIAASIKFYPGMLAFLFLKDKKYREFLLFVFFTSAVTILSLLLFKGGFVENIKGFIANIHISESAFAIGFKESLTSLIDMIKMSAYQIVNQYDIYGSSLYQAGVKYFSSLF